MTSSLGFYIKPKVLHSPSFEDDDLFGNDEEDQDFENAEYLQEVPYTSSSVDRSSIGSIPWADDAIKLNQVEWEKIEKMLAGLEDLPAEEDLRNEISDWQKKFPQLIGQKAAFKMKSLSTDTLELESLPSLNLSSDEGDLDMDDKITLTRDGTRKRASVEELSVTPTPTLRKSSEKESANLCHLLQSFTLTSVPLKLSQRDTIKKPINKRKCASSSSSYSLHSPPTPSVKVPQPTTQLRMPPILNVLESTRRFRNLGRQNINPSFVQLTQVHQAKSAVITQEPKSRSRFHTGHRSAWHVPLAANRFFNSRNSILLPAISSRQQILHQYNSQPTTISTSSELGTTNSTPSITRGNVLRANINSSFKPTGKRDILNGFSTTTSTTQTNTSGNSGRSISAAVQYPRATFNALYLPYSASKFNAFK